MSMRYRRVYSSRNADGSRSVVSLGPVATLLGGYTALVFFLGLIGLATAWPFLDLYGPQQGSYLPEWEQEVAAAVWYPLLVILLVLLVRPKSTSLARATSLCFLATAFIAWFACDQNNVMGLMPVILGTMLPIALGVMVGQASALRSARATPPAVPGAVASVGPIAPRPATARPATTRPVGPAAPDGSPPTCHYCGQVLGDESVRCSNCGAPQPATPNTRGSLKRGVHGETTVGRTDPPGSHAEPTGQVLSTRHEAWQNGPVAPDIATVWARIQKWQGQTFTQKRGGQFTYRATASHLTPDRTNRLLPKSDFAKALRLVPLSGPGQIQQLQGPSYIYAVLMDRRVRLNDW